MHAVYPQYQKKALKLIPVIVRGFVSHDKSIPNLSHLSQKKESSMMKFTEVTNQHQAMLAVFLYKDFNSPFFHKKFFYIYMCAYIKI